MNLELRVPPLAVWAVCVAVGAGSAWLVPVPAWAWSAGPAVGTALAVAGGAVALAGVWEFKRQRTTVNPMSPQRAARVVSSGIYRVTRNPMYLGLALALLGLAAAVGHLATWLMVPMFVAWMTRWQIVPEERVLLGLFGDEYSAYLRRVRRWV